MQFATGELVGEKVVIRSSPLADGSNVTALTAEAEQLFALSPQDEEELLAAMQEIDRGEFVSAEQLLESLRPNG